LALANIGLWFIIIIKWIVASKLRYSHEGKVCSGDYSTNTTLSDYDPTKEDWYMSTYEFGKGNLMAEFSYYWEWVVTYLIFAFIAYSIAIISILPCLKKKEVDEKEE
jgi:hypothetical protein